MGAAMNFYLGGSTYQAFYWPPNKQETTAIGGVGSK